MRAPLVAAAAAAALLVLVPGGHAGGPSLRIGAAEDDVKAPSFAETKATANVVVINAILTRGMRERNPDKEYPTFTPAEEIADALLYLCSDAAGRMNGQRLELHP